MVYWRWSLCRLSVKKYKKRISYSFEVTKSYNKEIWKSIRIEWNIEEKILSENQINFL